MQYILLFFEGIITFISPCLLPLLPVYITYFAGGSAEEDSAKFKPLVNSSGFVLGFTVVFVAMGAFAGTVGSFFLAHNRIINLITGAVVIIFGLSYLGVLKVNLLPQGRPIKWGRGKPLTPVSSLLFGIIFSIAWIPCLSKFLAAALMRAAVHGSPSQGMVMLFVYSMGLGIPFIISAVLIHRLKDAFDFIKKHQRVVNIISGSLLIIIGLLMMTGLFERFVSIF